MKNLHERSFPLRHTHKKGWADEQQYYRHWGIVSDFAVTLLSSEEVGFPEIVSLGA